MSNAASKLFEDDNNAAWGYRSTGESRWPPTFAVLVALVGYLLLPSKLVIHPAYVIPGIEVVALLAQIIANPSRLDTESRDVRKLSLVLISFLTLANAYALGVLINNLLNGKIENGKTLIYSGAFVWLTNVIVFSLWMWEIDRGGPIARCLKKRRDPDLMFPQMSDSDVVKTKWTPKFFDYMYVSLTNSLAFSPTDTMPLSIRMKALMSVQSIVSFATIIVVGARAVNILN